MHRTAPISPIRVFAIVLAVVFAVEMAIMIAIAFLTSDRTPPPDMRLSLLDASILVVVLCPVLWLLVVRPLQTTSLVRGALLARIFAIQEEERATLARDLHDELGQTQTAVLLGARSIASAETLADARARAEEVARIAAGAVDASRRLARGLAPLTLQEFGLAVAAERLCEDLEVARGSRIARVIDLGSRRFAAEIEIGAYRVLQEAINNAVKHARAAQIEVVIAARDRSLELTVTDDGVGMSSAGDRRSPGGMGLAGMRERVSQLHGELSVKPGPTRGTTVHAHFPVFHERGST